ncbi:hypothetical protein CARUB_v10012674mg [Capsella rubella]|uniref:Uncharacterized protein n=1 Tax=Capsella rubella TaxID=81985 RepID=R0GPT0_9BRAS|nr:hypothetical protein CARUB_v10012674mg [Capsella rubella]
MWWMRYDGYDVVDVVVLCDLVAAMRWQQFNGYDAVATVRWLRCGGCDVVDVKTNDKDHGWPSVTMFVL